MNSLRSLVCHRSRMPIIAALALLLGSVAAMPEAAAANRVLIVDLDTVVHPLMGEIIADGLQQAADAGDEAVVLRLNTPGGLLNTTNEIVQDILASPVPVIAYVAPSGGHAASAGFIILVSADIAAMAPGTNAGAASPVFAMGGELEGTMKDKVENDTAASLRAVTDKRGRNSELAVKAVLESTSFTDQDALEADLIDVVAADIGELLQKVSGQEFQRFDGSQMSLDLAGAQTYSYEPNLRQRTLKPLIDPTIALLVLALGAVGIYIEVTSPGLIFPGVAGGILAVVGLMSLSLLPINIAGAVLIVLALGLFTFEAFTPVNGILAAGGVVAMVLGLVILVDTDVPELQIGLGPAIGITLPFAAISVFLLQLAIRSFRIKSASGSEAMVGEVGEARTDLAPDGTVFVHGELWGARAAAAVKRGQSVRVVRVEGLCLDVEPAGDVPVHPDGAGGG